jgi:L-2-hydroxyglutarate oxidase LhgO
MKFFMHYESIQTLVIGGGVIGLAVARALALSSRQVVLIEKEKDLGQHSSARNSEVIHAGIYYSTNSLKAQLCVQGKRLLYDYLHTRALPYKRIQKIITSTHINEETQLFKIYQQAQMNGIRDLQRLSAQQVHKLEPHVSCTAGILSPSTGILDSHAYMKSLKREYNQAQGIILTQTQLIQVTILDHGYLCTIQEVVTEYRYQIYCQELINCAGLWAHEIAKCCHPKADYIPDFTYAKGHYVNYHGPSPTQRLIYPIPEKGGLGIHLTLDLAGKTRFGPNVEWVEEINYHPMPTSNLIFFHTAIQKYLPHIRLIDLSVDYCGIRIKNKVVDHSYKKVENTPSDFKILQYSQHRHLGLIHLLAIESPGLTASLAIAHRVKQLLNRDRSYQ